MPVYISPFPAEVSAETSTEEKIAKIKQERTRLAKIQKELTAELGDIGDELHELDSALIAARRENREAQANIDQADRKLNNLEAERQRLQQHINTLRQAMLDEIAAAWQRASHSSAWMGVLTGVPVSDIPHRRYLLSRVMHSQKQDRQEYLSSIEQLANLESSLRQQRQELASLQQEKQQLQQKLEKESASKRRLAHRVKEKMKSGKRMDMQLAKEEKALLRLLDGLAQEVIVADNQVTSTQQIRKRKGGLAWPLKGRIVTGYHSRPAPDMPPLDGVQLQPAANGDKVRAMAAGQVRYADWFGGYGLMAIVDYGDGILGVYAHNDVLYKQLGDWVEEGETLADSGSTGWVSKQLLYFEIRDRGRPTDPKRWCRH
ncbi:murein hydrolase activator EnvC family protein [Mariprofundus erugo]|nr:peptidoglycan DD-metalloendopeptidase family protein [Mariprofundus erugo]